MCQLRAKLSLTWVIFDPRMANLSDFGWFFCMISGSVLHMVWIATTMEKRRVFVGFLHSFGAWEGWLGHLGNCFGGCWLQENDFSWILRVCGGILAVGQCLKPFLDAPWLGAGWLAGGLGTQEKPWTGGNPQRWAPAALGREPSEMGARSAGGARGGRARNPRRFFS